MVDMGNISIDITKPDLTQRAHFKFWYHEKLRYGDLDRNGHVNNITFFEFAQSGRVALFEKAGTYDGHEGHAWMVANVNLDFKGQLHFPGSVDIGTAVTRIGNSSVTLSQGLFEDDRCVAVVANIMVRVDLANSKPVTISPDIRASLGEIAPYLSSLSFSDAANQ